MRLSDGLEPRAGVRINWGAIFCGSVVTLAVIATLTLIANGVGLQPIKIIAVDVGGGVQVGSWIYQCAAWILAFFAGAICAARIARIRGRGEAALHGLVSWALAGFTAMLIGLQSSLTFALLLTGAGPASANWLLVAVAVAGAGAAAAGGALGSPRAVARPAETVVEERRAA